MSSRGPASKVVLITGANKGIGLETGRQLGRLGMTVLLGSRDEARGAVAAESLRKEGLDARAIALEVTDDASIRDAAAMIEREFGRLDVLVNNAGVFAEPWDSTPTKLTLKDLRRTFDVNFFGMVAVTQTLLPLIRKGDAGRIVNLTSILGSLGEHRDPNSGVFGMLTLGYNASKAAVNMFTIQLAHELRETNIKVNAAHPGWVKTDMGGPQAPLEVIEGAKTSVWLATLPADGPTGGFYHLQVHMRW
jgi:NAD(P)-dependent dehydrogenase (short-subunit alcohol dehydrogenase family)